MRKGYRASDSNTRVATTITEKQHAVLKRWAQRNEVDMSHLLRQIITSAIHEYEVSNEQ